MEHKKIGCVIMASGMSVRYGKNKLLEEFCGKTLLQIALDLTGNGLFSGRVVVTRKKEVAEICRELGVEVILHELPGRNDTVRLGIQALREMDGWVFCPCDQPLLTRKSLEKLLDSDEWNQDNMIRVKYGEKQGAPVGFGKTFYEELCNLPEKKGGSYLIKKYPEKVVFVETEREEELWDADTPEQLEMMRSRV